MRTDEEISEDEEEILLYVEFEGLVDSNTFREEQLQLDITGIDTEHPIMQINGKFYEGTYEDAVGTYMFFTKDENSTIEDPVFDDTTNLKYFAKTRKLLKMQRIFIKPRTEVLGDSEHNQCIPNLNTLAEAGIPVRYQTEALSFWKTMRNNRLNALHSYLERQRIRQQKKSEGITLDSESDEDNPFAIYRHKQEESNSTNRPPGISTHLQDQSGAHNRQLCSKAEYYKESDYGIRDINDDSCASNPKTPPIILKSGPSMSNSHSSQVVKSAKDQKTKRSRKKNTDTNHRTLRVLSETEQTHSKNTVMTTKMEVEHFGENAEEPDKSNVGNYLSSLETTNDECERENSANKITATEHS